MKKSIVFPALFFVLFVINAAGQDIKAGKVPAAVRSALNQKYPEAKRVLWEKENGNYEANWGGKSGEDNSVQFTPSGDFIEMVQAIPVSQLPAAALTHIKDHYKGAKIREAGKVTDAKGKTTYEAMVNKKELAFDESGKFISF